MSAFRICVPLPSQHLLLIKTSGTDVWIRFIHYLDSHFHLLLSPSRTALQYCLQYTPECITYLHNLQGEPCWSCSCFLLVWQLSHFSVTPPPPKPLAVLSSTEKKHRAYTKRAVPRPRLPTSNCNLQVKSRSHSGIPTILNCTTQVGNGSQNHVDPDNCYCYYTSFTLP